MKILYVASRINADDGSSVHCRAFVDHVAMQGHDIQTFPRIKSQVDKPWMPVDKRDKNLSYYLKKINLRTMEAYLHRSNGYVSELISFIKGLKKTRQQARAILKALSEFPADVIIFRHQPFNLAPFKAAKQFGIPVVQEVNSLRTMEAPLSQRQSKVTFLSRWTERKAIQSATRLYAVSEPIKNAIDNYTGQPKCTVIPNGVDTAEFNPASHDRDAIRKKIGVTEKIVLGYVGSYKIWHGLETAVNTLQKLRQRNPMYHLVLIGSGPCFSKIESMVSQKGLTESVTQIKTVPHHDIPEYITIFDFALMTYPIVDNFYFSPLKMFEYMAMQVPVVSTNIGQIGEILTNEQTGILIHPPKTEKFAKAIEGALKNRQRIGMNARKLMISQYSWLENSKRALAISKKAIDEFNNSNAAATSTLNID